MLVVLGCKHVLERLMATSRRKSMLEAVLDVGRRINTSACKVTMNGDFSIFQIVSSVDLQVPLWLAQPLALSIQKLAANPVSQAP